MRQPITYRGMKITLIVLGGIISMLVGSALYLQHYHASSLSDPFFAAIDTMKVSRDTARQPLSEQEITKIVDASASLNANYITVDTQWDYPGYMAEWIKAIRSTGRRHVWFRIAPNQWEDTNGSTGIMTPAQYIASEREFILAHPSFFEPGDILDPCSEAEQGLYWKATYGQGWTNNAPNVATSAYNAFLRQTTDVADATLQQNGINGVITTIRSVNSFVATHPSVLERIRSEEHTSELQSPDHLVCRLLLEKKKIINEQGSRMWRMNRVLLSRSSVKLADRLLPRSRVHIDPSIRQVDGCSTLQRRGPTSSGA